VGSHQYQAGSLVELADRVKLPNLPLYFWNYKGIRAIREVLGSFISVDERYKTSGYRLFAYILMDMDPRNGLFESMDLVHGERKYTQTLDCVNIPFHRARCHRVGHFVKDFDLIFYDNDPKKDWDFSVADGSSSHSLHLPQGELGSPFPIF
jgi:hypothetical protein